MIANQSLQGRLDFDGKSKVHRLFDGISWDSLPTSVFPIKDANLPLMYAVREDWYERLCILRCGRGSSVYPSDAQIAAFTSYLIDCQRKDRSLSFGFGSWAMPEDTRMPSDAAVDFAFYPSYIALAWLVLVRDRYPRLSRELTGFDQAISRGLRFAVRSKLRGNGYDSNQQMLEGIRLLSLGGVFTYVRKFPARHRAFAEILESVEYHILEGMPKETGWSTTSAVERHHALALIRGRDVDDAFVCPSVWRAWEERQRSWFLSEVTKQAAAAVALPALQEVDAELRERREEFVRLAEEIRPEHQVFASRGRSVRSDPVPLRVLFDVRQALSDAVAEVGAAEWRLPPMKDQELLDSIKEELAHEVCAQINSLLRLHTEHPGEGVERTLVTPIVDAESGHLTLFVQLVAR